jgi:SAM-dependent MidA family methyltransferase
MPGNGKENRTGMGPHKDLLQTGISIDRSNPTSAFLAQQIQASGGRIPYSVFMETSLFGPAGYYSKGRAEIGRGKDFLTSAVISDLFGQTIGKSAVKVWEAMGRPKKFDFVEMGAGNGALADAFLNWAKAEQADFYNALNYVIVEHGDLIEIQKSKIRNAEKVQWHQESASELSLTDIEGVFYSNELPDAMPVEIVKKIDGVLKQKFVTLQNEKWVEVWDEPVDDVTAYIRDYDIAIEEEIEEPINLNAVKWQKKVNKALKRGAIITFDYGTNGTVGTEDRATRIFGNPFVVNSVDYPEYTSPGEFDITTDVNFAVLAQTAEREEEPLAVAFSGVQQEFLLKNGINELVSPQLEKIRNTRSWKEILGLSRKFEEYRDLLGEGEKQFGDFYVQALTKGVMVDFNPPDSIPFLSVSDTGVRLNFGRPNEQINVEVQTIDIPGKSVDSETHEVVADASGFVALGDIQLLPHELLGGFAREVRVKTPGETLLDTRDEARFREIIENSGYEYDVVVA